MKRELARELSREYLHSLKELTPRITEAVTAQPLMDLQMALGLVVSQNLLRDCMVHVTNMATPQPREYFLELAIRLACYLITALPVDDQEIAAMAVREGILNKLGHMQSEGHVLNTEWGD